MTLKYLTGLFAAFALCSLTSAEIERGLTTHFSNWLNSNGYGSYGFERTDLKGGAYGGKESDDEMITHEPVVFFHGNSDVAVGYNYWQVGFTESIEYFLSQGYTKGELYITTWGPGSQLKTSQQTHNQDYLQYLRAFTEAVLEYTGAEKIDIISHSMGVTLGRKVIKGGYDTANSFDMGDPMTDRVDAFVGISGANYGLVACWGPTSDFTPTCNKDNGFYPGATKEDGPSVYLNELNEDPTREGSYVYAMLSTYDDLIMYHDIVYGQYTSDFPTSDDTIVFDDRTYTHIHMRDLTKELQYELVVNHQQLAAQ